MRLKAYDAIILFHPIDGTTQTLNAILGFLAKDDDDARALAYTGELPEDGELEIVLRPY